MKHLVVLVTLFCTACIDLYPQIEEPPPPPKRVKFIPVRTGNTACIDGTEYEQVYAHWGDEWPEWWRLVDKTTRQPLLCPKFQYNEVDHQYHDINKKP